MKQINYVGHICAPMDSGSIGPEKGATAAYRMIIERVDHVG
ncbi:MULTISPECIES: hypothetical protein [unclassified Bradyrhizobium]|nr:hypothetical protein [Bradyrhizobium sp. CCBAU 21359]